jgi:hypothetical protein
MSTHLYWEPSSRKKKSLPTGLKWAFQKRFNGSIHAMLCTNDIPYLEGLRDAGIEGAQELIDAIDQYECIDLIEEE